MYFRKHRGSFKIFHECNKFACFFQKSFCICIALYDGSTLKRLLTTRWSGHREATSRLKENYKNVVDCLKIARAPTSSMKIDTDNVALATGLLSLIRNDECCFFTFILNEVLELVDIGNKVLQSRGKQNVLSAVSVIESVKNQLIALPTAAHYPDEETIRNAVEKSMDVELRTEIGGKRRKSVPNYLIDDFLVTERLPSARTETGRYRPILVDMVDRLTAELDDRFQDRNTHLWASMQALLPSSPNILVATDLVDLFNYAMTVPLIARKLSGKTLKHLKSECQVFQPVLSEIEWEVDVSTKTININDVASYVLKNFSKAAVILSELFKISIVAGYASVTNECSFSSLQKIDAPRRRSMSPYGECDLTFLYFEREELSAKTFEEFIAEWYKKPRRL